MPIRVTIWNEFRHEKTSDEVRSIYPDGIHAAIKKHLDGDASLAVTLASLDQPEQGLPDSLLDATDVLVWWGHMHHQDVSDELARKVQGRVLHSGMGFVPLHSSHMSKPFGLLMGTSGGLTWGEEQREIVWTMLPGHDIAAGIPENFELEREEMYCEFFDIPQPDELIFGSWFQYGSIFRSGCAFYRGRGRVFYFQPGHETCRSFHNEHVLRVIRNAVHWAAPRI